MNRREVRVGDHGNINLRAPRKVSNCFKDREEELSFFRDIQKREKDQFASLLQPIISDEFEANGNYGGLYRMNSGGRKGPALEFLAESGKNDYNWLKTPPATPLFPSLEMEAANGQELIVQREIPIIQPLSRFAGNIEGTKTSTNTSTSSNSKPKLLPQIRHKTPTGRPSISSTNDKKNMKTAPVVPTQKTSQSLPTGGLAEKTKQTFTPVVKPIIHNESRPSNFLASNLSKSIDTDQKAKLRIINRGVSPLVRPKIPGFSDETPSNLRTTARPSSATRGRPINQNPSALQKQDISVKNRRQSCSPSVTRGRKPELSSTNAAQNTTAAIKTQLQAGSRGQVVGSRMVDRFMNARISSAEDRTQAKVKMNSSMNESLSSSGSAEDRQVAAKIKLNGSLNESSGIGRFMSKNSLDMALKHMEFQRESHSNRKNGAAPGRH